MKVSDTDRFFTELTSYLGVSSIFVPLLLLKNKMLCLHLTFPVK